MKAERKAWRNMINRTSNPKCVEWNNYGARGISVCPRWRNSFADFFSDMGPRPDGYSIERKNNDGNYEPENCAWIPRAHQARNRRKFVSKTTAQFTPEVREKITKMEAELKTLKRIARCPHDPLPGVGGAIQRIRQKCGVSLSSLSESAHVAKGNLSRIETTEYANPKLYTLVAIADALDVTTLELLKEGGIK